ATGTISCSTATLNSGTSVVFTFVVRLVSNPSAGSTITNTATVSSNTTDPVPGNNSSSAQATVGAPPTPVGVPTLSNLGLMLLAAAMLGQAAWAGNRRRKRQM